jgi:hypothetical protein
MDDNQSKEAQGKVFDQSSATQTQAARRYRVESEATLDVKAIGLKSDLMEEQHNIIN